MTILFVDIWSIDIILKGHFTCSIYYLLLIVTLNGTLPLPDHVICGWSLISNCQSISVRVRVLNDEQPDNNTSDTRRVVATGVYVYIVYCLFWEIFAYFGLRIDVYFCNIIAIDGGGWCVCVPVSVLRCDRPAGPGPGRALFKTSI